MRVEADTSTCVMMISRKRFRSDLAVYHEQTQPLIDYYKTQGILKIC